MLKKLVAVLVSLLSIAVVVVLVVSLARIPIDISRYHGLIERQASQALGRRVSVEGEVIVTTSLWPYIELAGLRVASPSGVSDEDLITMERARVTVGLLPLLDRQLHILSFAVEGLSINLVRSEDGQVNWATVNAAQPVTDQAPPPTEDAGTQPFGVAVDQLLLGDIALRFEDRPEAQVQTFMLREAEGAAPFGEPMSLKMKGTLREEPYALSIAASSLKEFLAMAHTRVDLQIDIAGTRIEFGGFTDRLGRNLRTELELAVRGDRLDSLNRLLDMDLPPLEKYSFDAGVVARPGKLEMTGMSLRVGESILSGTALLDETAQPPVVSLDLVSDSLQLRDFDTGDWSPEPEPDSEPASADTTPTEDAQPAPAKPPKPLSPEALQRLNARLSLSVKEVLSGTDNFGGGEFKATLQDGRLSIDPLQLESGEQSVLLRVSVKPSRELSDASLRVLAENIDLAALIRLLEPDSDVGGVLNVDVDVQTEASRFQDLLANANGYFDISAVPENLQSGLVDLWAVNLLASVVDSAVKGDDAPQINCLLSRWSLEDGRMKAQQLAVDTSRIRICAGGRVDFGERRIKLSAWPKAKRPEFFSLATPLKVKGTFDDFGVGLKGGAVAVGTTAVGFVISPITTPFKRLLRDDLPEDGGDMCSLPIGPHGDELESLPGC